MRGDMPASISPAGRRDSGDTVAQDMRRREAPSPQASERRGMAVIPASWQAWSEQRLNACRGQGRKREMDRIFPAFAHRIARWSGQPAAFILTVLVIRGWHVPGPLLHSFDTCQLINSGN